MNKKSAVIILITLLGVELIFKAVFYFNLGTAQSNRFFDQLIRWHVEGEMTASLSAAAFVRTRPAATDQLNGMGFHSPDISVIKEDSIVRIGFLGGSTTYDQGPLIETYPHFVQNELSTVGWNVEYINAGVPGYTSTECLLTYHLRLVPLKPDVVVFYNGRNEVMVSGNNKYSALDPTTRYQPPEYSNPTPTHRMLSKVSYIYMVVSEGVGHHSFLSNNWSFQLAHSKQFRTQAGIPESMNEFMENVKRDEALKLYQRNVEALATLTGEQDTQLMLVGFDFYADKIQSNALARDRHLTKSEIELLNTKISQLNHILESIAQAHEHVAYLNLAGRIDRNEFLDDCHLTKAGKQQKGALIGKFIHDHYLHLVPSER